MIFFMESSCLYTYFTTHIGARRHGMIIFVVNLHFGILRNRSMHIACLWFGLDGHLLIVHQENCFNSGIWRCERCILYIQGFIIEYLH